MRSEAATATSRKRSPSRKLSRNVAKAAAKSNCRIEPPLDYLTAAAIRAGDEWATMADKTNNQMRRNAAATRFATLDDIARALEPLPAFDQEAIRAATARNATLTKPAGALGRLETLAIWVAGVRGQAQPRIERPQAIIFAGNHGVTAAGVSAYPSEVTAQMVANFEAGGAAINQLAQVADAALRVVPIALDQPTTDFSHGPAMTEAEAAAAFQIGWDAVDAKMDLLAVGEMGIGNTTVASALSAALFGGGASDWVGGGASPDGATLDVKRAVVERALTLHRPRWRGARNRRLRRCAGWAAESWRRSPALFSAPASSGSQCCSTASSPAPPQRRWPKRGRASSIIAWRRIDRPKPVTIDCWPRSASIRFSTSVSVLARDRARPWRSRSCGPRARA